MYSGTQTRDVLAGCAVITDYIFIILFSCISEVCAPNCFFSLGGNGRPAGLCVVKYVQSLFFNRTKQNHGNSNEVVQTWSMQMEPSLHPLPWHLASATPLIIQHH